MNLLNRAVCGAAFRRYETMDLTIGPSVEVDPVPRTTPGVLRRPIICRRLRAKKRGMYV